MLNGVLDSLFRRGRGARSQVLGVATLVAVAGVACAGQDSPAHQLGAFAVGSDSLVVVVIAPSTLSLIHI